MLIYSKIDLYLQARSGPCLTHQSRHLQRYAVVVIVSSFFFLTEVSVCSVLLNGGHGAAMAWQIKEEGVELGEKT